MSVWAEDDEGYASRRALLVHIEERIHSREHWPQAQPLRICGLPCDHRHRRRPDLDVGMWVLSKVEIPRGMGVHATPRSCDHAIKPVWHVDQRHGALTSTAPPGRGQQADRRPAHAACHSTFRQAIGDGVYPAHPLHSGATQTLLERGHWPGARIVHGTILAHGEEGRT